MNDLQRFSGMRAPTTDFAAVRTDLQTLPMHVDIDLSTARSYAAATHLEIPLNGNFVYIDQKQNSGAATLYLDDAPTRATGITLFPGFIARVPYTKLIIENAAQPGQTMRLIYGVDVGIQPGVSPGTGQVNVIDGAGEAFMNWGSANASPGQYAHVQLFNSHTVRNLVVERFTLSSATSTAFHVGITNTALATSLRNAASKLGAASDDPNSATRSENLGALITTQRLLYSRMIVNQPFTYEFTEPVVLPPGYAMFVANDVVNADLTGTFEFFREPI